MRSRIGMAAALGAAALALAACGSSGGGSSSAPGVTKTSVKVGGHFPLTGPAAPGYSNIPPAVKAYFSYINAHGGVNGRKLTLVARDDGYNPAKTVTVTKQLVLQDKIFAMLDGLGTPTHTKVVDFLNAERVPDLFVASGCLCWNEPSKHPQTFGWLTDYYREGKILGRWVTQHEKGKKVAYFLQNDDFGADGARGADKFIPKSQVVTRQTYEPGNTDIGPQMSKIKSSGAQVVVSFSIPAYTALELLA
ncbi:MAG TPA: ABC transporter substrate-binding protein, partial [Solirubrobacteraceae bacterium]